MTLGELGIGVPVTVVSVGGERAFRRRLMELGLLPGTEVEIVRVAPLGDPLELGVRGCRLSIRRDEAVNIEVSMLPARERSESAPAVVPVGSGVPAAP